MPSPTFTHSPVEGSHVSHSPAHVTPAQSSHAEVPSHSLSSQSTASSQSSSAPFVQSISLWFGQPASGSIVPVSRPASTAASGRLASRPASIPSATQYPSAPQT